MKKEVVIARYKEDLAWTESISSPVVITVYNKSEDTTPQGRYDNWINLPNGDPPMREAGTYLRHLIHRYDSHADLTFFLQGHPFAHQHPFVNPIEVVVPANGFDWRVDHILDAHPDGCPAHCGIPVGEMFRDIFDREGPQMYSFGAGAQFVVTKELILSKPQSFYQKVYDLLEGKYSERGPWILERLWGYIFKESI